MALSPSPRVFLPLIDIHSSYSIVVDIHWKVVPNIKAALLKK
jgi:hypothetical protein